MSSSEDRRSATADDFPDPADALDPIGQLPALPHGGAPAERAGLRALLTTPLLLLATVPIYWALGRAPGLTFAALVVGDFFYARYAAWKRGPGPLMAAIRRAAPHAEPRAIELPSHRGDLDPVPAIGLPLTPPPDVDRRPFGPTDPDDVAMARRLRDLRLGDGVALTDELQITLPQLQRHPGHAAPESAADWVGIWRWLTGLTDPRAGWLGAMALTEETRWRRALHALEALGDPPWRDALRRAMLAGPHPTRLAAAVHWRDPAALDAMLDAAAPMSTARRIELVEARMDFDDPPIARWLDDPEYGPALVTFGAARLAPSGWLRLVARPDPAVACAAAERALTRDPDHALRAARALLDRDDVLAAARDRRDPAVTAALELMIIRLGTDGDASDLPRVGRCAGIPGLGRATGHELDALRARLTSLPDGGGLALATAPGGDLALADGE